MTSQLMTVAVTGGTGFIGRSVLEQLRARFNSIRALTRRSQTDDSITWVEGDLENDGALARLVDGADIVIHIAGLTKAANRQTLFDANARAVGRFASHAQRSGVKRFVLVSSLAAREPHLSDYAASKYAGEQAALAAAGDMELIIVRPPAIIGPDDDATAQMLDTMKRGWLPVPGGANHAKTRLSFMYVDDIAAFILQQIDSAPPNSPLEPSVDADGTSWEMLATTASEILSKPVRLIRISPIILFPAAYATQTFSALFGQATFFNTGKVREMLHTDWTGSNVMKGARAFKESLALALGQDIAK